MEDKFQNKYRTQSNRLKNWDYSNAGYYSVTICTKDKINFFGSITNGVMHLSKIGVILETEWYKTPELRKDLNLELDEFVIMPNHFHCIIILNEIGSNNVDTERNISRDVCNTSLQSASNNLSAIVRGLKAAVTSQARKLNPNFAWQTNYYDHVIRNEKSLYEIRKYIMENPLKWELDEYNNSKIK
ncbi:MAG: transposase [Candidatus Kapaibacterium sp.]|jgi:REP element-mobilizing transposase RayT